MNAVGERHVSVVIHDVAPPTLAACTRLLHALRPLGSFPVTLLAVPRYHGAPRDAAFERWLYARAAAGDEVALHGYTHRDAGRPVGTADWLRRRVYTRGEGEFWSLSFEAAQRRLDAGRAWLAALGLHAEGFVPPAWLINAEAWRALAGQPFAYTCTLRRIHLLDEQRSVVCQAQVYSAASAWRRAASTIWNDVLAERQRSMPLMRLELHPGDAAHPGLVRSWRRVGAQALRTREPITLAGWVARQRSPVRTAPARPAA